MKPTEHCPLKETKYNSVWACNVFDRIKDGKKVFVLDKKKRSVLLVNEMSVSNALAMTRSKEQGRFEFWYVEDENNG